MMQPPPPEEESASWSQLELFDYEALSRPPTGPHNAPPCCKLCLLDQLMAAMGMETTGYTPAVKPRRRRRRLDKRLRLDT